MLPPPPPNATKGRDPWPFRGAPLFPLTPMNESPPDSNASTPSLERSTSFDALSKPSVTALPGEMMPSFSRTKVVSKSS